MDYFYATIPHKCNTPEVFPFMEKKYLRNILAKYIPDWKKEAVLNISYYIDMDGTVNYWDEKGNIYEPHYFLNRKPFWNVIGAIALLKSYGCKLYFGTSVIFDIKDAFTDKVAWVKKIGLGDIPVIGIPYGANKDDYLLGDNKFLLDDYNPNLNSFSGKKAKLLNGINNKRGSWKGPVINKDDEPLVIALKIINAACT